jgi:hypothetical protein
MWEVGDGAVFLPAVVAVTLHTRWRWRRRLLVVVTVAGCGDRLALNPSPTALAQNGTELEWGGEEMRRCGEAAGKGRAGHVEWDDETCTQPACWPGLQPQKRGRRAGRWRAGQVECGDGTGTQPACWPGLQLQKMGRRGEGWAAAELPVVPAGNRRVLHWRSSLLASPPLVWERQAGSNGEGRVRPRSAGGDILPPGGLAAY